MEHCCCMWLGDTQSLFSSLDFISVNATLGTMNYILICGLSCTDETSLASGNSKDFQGRFSNELHSLIPPVNNFTARKRHAVDTGLNHSHSPCIPWIKNKFYSDSFFQRTAFCGTSSQVEG